MEESKELAPPGRPIYRQARVRRIAALLLLCAVALAVRTVPRYETVFSADGVRFQELDSWYHLRVIEHLLHNLPERLGFDPYGAFPGGQPVATGPMFDYSVAALTWLVTGGSPDTATMEAVAAWLPALLGAALPILVYFLGRALFGPLAGLLAAFVVALMPGSLLRVSMLGFADHHAMETVLCGLVMLCLFRALQKARRERISYSHPIGKATAVWTTLAGVSLGCYLATWIGGALLVAVIVAWALLDCLLRHFRRRPCQEVVLVVAPAMAVALILSLPAMAGSWGNLALLALSGGIAGVPLFGGLADYLLTRRRSPFLLPMIVAGVAGLTAALVFAISPETVRELLGQLRFLSPSGSARMVAELRPLVVGSYAISVNNLYVEFGITIFLALPAVAMIAYRGYRHGRSELGLFLIWSLAFLLLSARQVRMDYYTGLNVALAAGLAWHGLLENSPRRFRGVAAAGLGILVAVTSLAPMLSVARPSRRPSTEWRATMDWLRNHTPEPFSEASFFHAPYPKTSEAFEYPDSAYSILNWWDEGYWITYLARRIPVANGTQTHAGESARFYLAEEPDEALKILRQMSARYVLVDGSMPMFSVKIQQSTQAVGRLFAMSIWAGEKPQRYYEVLRREVVEGVMENIVVYYPEYYRTMMARLYLFDGAAVTPEDSTWVIDVTPAEPPGSGASTLLRSRRFPTYEDAQQFVATNAGRDLRIASIDPLRSPIPLRALDGYRLEYESTPENPGIKENVATSVKVFSTPR